MEISCYDFRTTVIPIGDILWALTDQFFLCQQCESLTLPASASTPSMLAIRPKGLGDWHRAHFQL